MPDNEFEDLGPGRANEFPEEFREAVDEALEEAGYKVSGWEEDGVNVIAPEGDGPADDRSQYIGLSNLHRRARALETWQWPGLVREFLAHLRETFEGPEIPKDLGAIVAQLRPRLGRPFSRETPVHPWGVPIPGTGLEINLVIDYPNSMAYVTNDMLKTTSLKAEDLLERSLENLRAETPEDFFEQVSDQLDIFVGHTGDGYDAARALLVEDLLPQSPAGYWVVVPSRDELAVWPVSYAALPKIQVIKLFAEDNFRNHAYPVSEDVFWVWEGQWHVFKISVDEQNVIVSPPEEFMAALKRLGGEGSDEEGGQNGQPENGVNL